MDAGARIEQALETALSHAQGPGCPPKLGEAVSYAVFPGGARIRPRLCLAVAHACGDATPAVTEAAATAIELLHCASLVHDDLPAFDDAPFRRGKASVHLEFGEPIAVLVGDALIVLAFETLARAGQDSSKDMSGLFLTIARSVGMPFGIVAGQAWESESQTVLADYQRAKTGSLFVAAVTSGAEASGQDPEAWRMLGERLGEAYQVMDDIRDVIGNAEKIGKPTGQDLTHDRPNAIAEMGVSGAVRHLDRLLSEAVDSIPGCPGRKLLRGLILKETAQFLPKEVWSLAA